MEYFAGVNVVSMVPSALISASRARASIDLDGVTEVRVQQSIDWMHHTQLPIGPNYIRLSYTMSS
jgi:hypothetical protein